MVHRVAPKKDNKGDTMSSLFTKCKLPSSIQGKGSYGHQCHFCPYVASSARLIEHMRIHTGERTFQCSMWSRKFTQWHVLSMHMLRHTGEKPFARSFCPSVFKWKQQRKRHKRSTSEAGLLSQLKNGTELRMLFRSAALRLLQPQFCQQQSVTFVNCPGINGWFIFGYTWVSFLGGDKSQILPFSLGTILEPTYTYGSWSNAFLAGSCLSSGDACVAQRHALGWSVTAAYVAMMHPLFGKTKLPEPSIS